MTAYTEWELTLPQPTPADTQTALATLVLEHDGAIAPSPTSPHDSYRIRLPAGKSPSFWDKIITRGLPQIGKRRVHTGTLGNEVRIARSRLGLTQRQLADRVNCTVTEIYQAEYGEWTPALARICAVLGVSDEDYPSPLFGRLGGMAGAGVRTRMAQDYGDSADCPSNDYHNQPGEMTSQ